MLHSHTKMYRGEDDTRYPFVYLYGRHQDGLRGTYQRFEIQRPIFSCTQEGRDSEIRLDGKLIGKLHDYGQSIHVYLSGKTLGLFKTRRAAVCAVRSAVLASSSIYPITHNHGTNMQAAEAHCWAMVQGGWKAKVMNLAGQGWQVVITGFRGMQHARSV